MNEHLELLITLQDLDRELDCLGEKKAGILREIESLGENLGNAQRKVERIKARRVERTKERKKKELEIESSKEALEKVQAKLPAINNNREYTALLKEIETDKAKISSLEDIVLDLMELLEEEDTRLKESQNLLAQVEEEHQKEKAKKKIEIDRLDGVLEEKTKRREKTAAPMEKRLYQNYTRLRQARKGLAVVPVSNGACRGCHISIPLQTINEIRKNEEIITCAGCSRILHWVL